MLKFTIERARSFTSELAHLSQTTIRSAGKKSVENRWWEDRWTQRQPHATAEIRGRGGGIGVYLGTEANEVIVDSIAEIEKEGRKRVVNTDLLTWQFLITLQGNNVQV